jgi:uncharacterized protein YcfJ
MCARDGAVLLLAAVVIFAGCESMGQKTKTGAVAGGLLGAAAGGIIGHQSGHGWEGAAIGAAAGAVGGGLVGNTMDSSDKDALAVNPSHITVIQIVDMAQKAIPDDVIISEIDRTHSVYNLTSEVITYLKENKVSDKVINYMLATAARK